MRFLISSFMVLFVFSFLICEPPAYQLSIGEPAPRISLFDYIDVVNGTDDIMKNSVKLFNNYGKKALVISFFTRDCINCKSEIPELIKLSEQYSKDKVEFYLILVKTKNDTMDLLKSEISDRCYTLPILSHRYPETVLKKFIKAKNGAILPVPLLYIIDKKGNISYIKKGFDSNNKEAEIAALNVKIKKAIQ